jgi:replicative DNA helicase
LRSVQTPIDGDVPVTRTPPQAIEAEQNVLGALMLVPQAYDRIEFLRAEHFYRADHRRIFECIVGMIERNSQVDALTVGDALEEHVERSYIAELVATTLSVAGIVGYARMVRSRWMLRQVISIATNAAADAFAVGADAKEIAEAAETAFLSVLDETKGGEEIGFEDAVKRAVDARDEPQTAVIPTGLSNIDYMLKGGGMRGGQLIILAGRPSMGKSALAFQIAERVAMKETVAAFTLEMTSTEIAERALTYHESLIPIEQAVLHCMDIKMRIDDSPAVSIGHIRLRARRIKRRYGLALIVVDYLQLMEAKGENREQQVASISRGLKAIAKELNVPVIAVAQINRGVEQRNDKRPLLSDLRESGSVEQDADIVLMLYREDYYHPDTPAKGVAEALIRKQRGGKTGTAYLMFTPETTRFHDYEGTPRYSDPAASGGGKVRNFQDYKSKASGEE